MPKTDQKLAQLRSIGEQYVTEKRRESDIDIYEAAQFWGITPKAAELRLGVEVRAGRGEWRHVRSDKNRVLKVFRAA